MIKKILVFLVAVALLYSGGINIFPYQVLGGDASGTLLVKIRDAAQEKNLFAYDPSPQLLFENVYRLKVINKDEALVRLRENPGVIFVEEDQRVQISATTNDPLFIRDSQAADKQWYLQKTRVSDAWDINQGSGITVALIDTGIDARHEDLNDGRVIAGYASYCQVVNPENESDCLVRNTGDLAAGVNSDDNGHGTIVAGIIGAIANNKKGIVGVGMNVLLMPIKALDSKGSGLSSDVAFGIKWAVDHGAKVVNLSIGGTGLTGVEIFREAALYALKKGAIVVAAAGNDAALTGGNLNSAPILPVCADGTENTIIGVTAVDGYDKKARFANYGSNCIDIAAPGAWSFVDKEQKKGLISTYYDPAKPGEHDLYVYAVGTSMAAPLVSGVVSLVFSAFPDLDVRAIRDRIITGVDNIDNVNQSGCNGSTCVGQIGKGRLNALKALTEIRAYSSGTLVQNFSGQRYLIERGLKRSVSDFVYNQRFPGIQVAAVDTIQLKGYPDGAAVPPVDGTLVKEPNNPTVYLVEGEYLRALSYVAFLSRKLSFDKIVTLTTEELARYARSADAPVLGGALLKSTDHPAVYIYHQGYRQLLSYFVFMQRGFDWNNIAAMSPQEIVQYSVSPDNYLYPPKEGSLIRGDEIATVYMIENGKRRGLTLLAFQNRNFRFSDVAVLPQSEVNGYELGSDIIE